jgi:predicted NBD/HSP70 family sugar kinase
VVTHAHRRASARAAPADQTVVRRHNLSLVLRLLQEGPRSRASIAIETGLNKATVSSLVTELAERGLARDLGIDQARRLGRPATLVELDGRNVATVGLQLNVDYLAVLATDLAGRVLHEEKCPLDAVGQPQDRALRALVGLAGRALREVHDRGATVAGLTVAVPGVVDLAGGRMCFAPNLGWRDVALVERLATGTGLDVPIALGNDANLGALAEYRVGELAGTANLIYLTGEIGVGGGVIVEGRPLLGANGFSAEVGHLQVDRDGTPCTCGSRGCWETLLGLRPLLRRAVPDLAPALEADGTLSPEAKVAYVVERAERGDADTLAALGELGDWLGIGLATLVNLFNPGAVVLAGFFSLLAPWMLPAATATLHERTIAPDAGGCRVTLSRLGFSAATLGGAIHAAERVYADPTLVPALSA